MKGHCLIDVSDTDLIRFKGRDKCATENKQMCLGKEIVLAVVATVDGDGYDNECCCYKSKLW